jgi:hypothetical protein
MIPSGPVVFVRVGFQDGRDLHGDAFPFLVELAVPGVVGFRGDVAREVAQFVERVSNNGGLAGWRDNSQAAGEILAGERVFQSQLTPETRASW